MADNDGQALAELADHLLIHELRANFTDAAMMNDHDRFVSLFTPDGSLRIPAAGVQAQGPEQLRALCTQRETNFELFVQLSHPGTVEIDGDTGHGRAVLGEIIRLRNGVSHRNWAIYHDRFARTEAGWRFTERLYEIRSLETTPPETDDVAAADADLSSDPSLS